MSYFKEEFMIDPATLGKRLRYFRDRSKMSQLELENEADMSFGSLSRIENGSINTTKETLGKISDILKLSPEEIDYLGGSLFNLASPSEIENAKLEVKEYFNRKDTLAYLLDDRYRFIDISKNFMRFLNINEEILRTKMIGRAFVSMVLDKEVGIIDRLYDFEELMDHLLERYYSEVGFMFDDKFYQDGIDSINENPITREIWEKVISKPPVNLQVLSTRKVHFKVHGLAIKLHYSNEHLKRNKRFQIIEYTPTNELVKLFAKIL